MKHDNTGFWLVDDDRTVEWEQFIAALIGPNSIDERNLLEQEMLEREREWTQSHARAVRHSAWAAPAAILIIGLWIWVIYAAVEAWM